MSNDGEKEVCTIEATVVTGFESTAQEECREKLKVPAKWEKGRIFFDMPVDRVSDILLLRGVDNLYVVVQDIKHFDFPDDKSLVNEKLSTLASEVNWKHGLQVWKAVMNYESLTVEEILQCGQQGQNLTGDDSADKAENAGVAEDGDTGNTIPSFRVTCNRNGEKHCFTSMEAAAHFGGAVYDLFHWKVKMKNYDMEVVLNINEDHVYVCIGLTKESLHYRNLKHFGPTSMRATIAYNLLRLAKIEAGDVVCDPMCGGGSIPIEAALNWPSSFHICGDNHEMAWPRTQNNILAVNERLQNEGKGTLKIDVFRWDATHLPLRDCSVDVFVTDLPFGKRLGSKWNNRTLYPLLLNEMARCSKPGKGRAVLLTGDKKSLSKAVGRCGKFWRQTRALGINMGGIAVCAYILLRTKEKWLQSVGSK